MAVEQMGATAVQPQPLLCYFSYTDCKYHQVIAAMSPVGLIFAS